MSSEIQAASEVRRVSFNLTRNDGITKFYNQNVPETNFYQS